MAEMAKLGMAPTAWVKPLQSHNPIALKWYGHYSALSPWPTTKKQLEDQQSSAEGWSIIDPLTLQLETSLEYSDGFWPAAFSTIPAFADTIEIPALSEDDIADVFTDIVNYHSPRETRHPKGHGSVTAAGSNDVVEYIRGVAPFMDLESMTKQTKVRSLGRSNVAGSGEKSAVHHPFLALRVRGIIHHIDPASTVRESDIPTNDDGSKRGDFWIPGWKRVCMVLWKPSKRYLLTVLEHAQEDYGGSHGVALSQAVQMGGLNTANVWYTPAGVGAIGGAPQIPQPGQDGLSSQQSPTLHQSSNATVPPSVSVNVVVQDQNQTQNENEHQPGASTSVATVAGSIDPEVLSNQLSSLLDRKLSNFAPLNITSTDGRGQASDEDPEQQFQFTAKSINRLEDDYASPHFLDWADDTIEYAYAYEGAVLPGGKIMMGRYWRCHGISGSGRGKEVDRNGEGVGSGTESESGSGSESGPGSESESNADGDYGLGELYTSGTKTQVQSDTRLNNEVGAMSDRMDEDADDYPGSWETDAMDIDSVPSPFPPTSTSACSGSDYGSKEARHKRSKNRKATVNDEYDDGDDGDNEYEDDFWGGEAASGGNGNENTNTNTNINMNMNMDTSPPPMPSDRQRRRRRNRQKALDRGPFIFWS